MADTDPARPAHRSHRATGAKLVAVGDAAQLPSIGAGGMFDRLTRITPCAGLSDVRRTLDPHEQRAWADLHADAQTARWPTTTHADNSTRQTPATRQSSTREELGETHRDPPDQRGRFDLRRLQPRDPPPQRPRPALPRTTRRARRARGRGPRSSLRHPPRRPDSDDRAAPRARSGAHREWQPRRSPPGHTRRRSAHRVRRHRPATNTRRRRPWPRAPRLRPAHSPRAGCNRDPHPRPHRLLADQQGARLRRGIPRARQGTTWFVNREDLGTEGHDTDRIQRLATNMRRSHAQTSSLAHPELPDPEWGPGFHHPIAPSRASRIPGIVRAINRIIQPSRTQERAR